MASCLTYAIAMILLNACKRLPSGDVNQLQVQRPARIVLIRGFLDWYSTGIDTIARQLKAPNDTVAVYRDEQWHHVADALCKTRDDAPLVLIGFSYGADDVVLIARQLDGHHRAVALLITIDPVTPSEVPANVSRCVNFYEPNGVWDVFPWLRGVPLTADKYGPVVRNFNIRRRADLIEPGTSHATIAANAKVHAAIIAEMRRTLE